ncbi:cell wall biogenesis protein Ecm15 [Histoplasma capsulatum]|uniref:Cell wall biogenesis protein Ecm15 n=1 Tax=Ajellomyces capsulatus TaxID=5037 RepID=A0A8A1M177_AJECA|nr:cell wall biogenesis protein Ecm15 [Histoplasma capsulatum]
MESISSTIATPPHCTADFCLIPIGTSSASVSQQIADVQRLVEKSGVKYVMHSAGTTLEGSWDAVFALIGQAHAMLHKRGIVRIQTDIRVGSRTDKVQSTEDKVAVVEKLLGKS